MAETLHAAQKVFIAADNSNRTKWALKHNIQKYNDVWYENGDKVYYKRKDSNKWLGPRFVIGQDNKQVMVKHGSNFKRVHIVNAKFSRRQIFSLRFSKWDAYYSFWEKKPC